MNTMMPFMKRLVVLLLAAFLWYGCGSDATSPDPDSLNDSIAPECKIISPTNGETVHGQVIIRSECTDNKKIVKVELLVNGNVISSLNKSPWDFSWNTEPLQDGKYKLQVRATDAAGNTSSSSEVEVLLQTPFTLKLINTTFTTMIMSASNQTNQTIAPGDTAKFVYDTNPGTISYSAYTNGNTTEGNQVGLRLEWNETLTINDMKSDIRRLVVSKDYFYIYIDNKSAREYSELTVNKNLQSETFDNIRLSASTRHRIGYYKAFTNTRIELMYGDGSNNYVFWEYGNNLPIPWTENQSVDLIITPGGIAKSLDLSNAINNDDKKNKYCE